MNYKNFKVAVYWPVSTVINIKDEADLDEKVSFVRKYVNLDKVYLETYRTDTYATKEQILMLKNYFNKNGIETSGGITPTTNKNLSGFWSLCYTNSEQKNDLINVMKFTAELFDEIIYDDFFFTNCTCKSCTEAKEGKSWAAFRTGLMTDISNILVSEAKKVNPNAHIIIKFPNWYEYYQDTGYSLDTQPQIFDSIYTGTETRNSYYTQQHLPRYLSYSIMRYLENVKPGKNDGGWFDMYDCTLDEYVEQNYLTMFSKPKEITLFNFGSLLDEKMHLAAVGRSFLDVDAFLGELGKPIGVSCYKPYNSHGEEHLVDYLGMLGIPIELTPNFESEKDVILLTASAACDDKIIDKIKTQLASGKNIVITSGLLEILQNNGLQDIVNLVVTNRRMLVQKYADKTLGCGFLNHYTADKPVLVPQIDYRTNDSWQIAVGINEQYNTPILHQAHYGNGYLSVLTIPDNYSDLYNYPPKLLNLIRRHLPVDSAISLDAESQVSLFLYNNNSFVVESFLPYRTIARITVKGKEQALVNLVNNKELKGITTGDNTDFEIPLPPHRYAAFKLKV